MEDAGKDRAAPSPPLPPQHAAFESLKTSLSEATDEKVGLNRLLREQLESLGKRLEEADLAASVSATSSARIIARLESRLEESARKYASLFDTIETIKKDHGDAIRAKDARHERQLDIHREQYRSLHERHLAERKEHAAERDRLEELLLSRSEELKEARQNASPPSHNIDVSIATSLAEVKENGSKILVSLASRWRDQHDAFSAARASYMHELGALEKMLLLQQQHLLSQCSNVSHANRTLRMNGGGGGRPRKDEGREPTKRESQLRRRDEEEEEEVEEGKVEDAKPADRPVVAEVSTPAPPGRSHLHSD